MPLLVVTEGPREGLPRLGEFLEVGCSLSQDVGAPG